MSDQKKCMYDPNYKGTGFRLCKKKRDQFTHTHDPQEVTCTECRKYINKDGQIISKSVHHTSLKELREYGEALYEKIESANCADHAVLIYTRIGTDVYMQEFTHDADRLSIINHFSKKKGNWNG